jgi:hypothetical protein
LLIKQLRPSGGDYWNQWKPGAFSSYKIIYSEKRRAVALRAKALA